MTRFASCAPDLLRVDAGMFFDHPECTSLVRIGVVSDIELVGGGSELQVRLGVGDTGQHTALMERIKGTSGREAILSGGLSHERAIISGWYDSSLESIEALGIICGVRGDRKGVDLPNEKTRICLEMSALALGRLLAMPYSSLSKLNDPSNLVFGRPLLTSYKRTIGKRIFN